MPDTALCQSGKYKPGGQALPGFFAECCTAADGLPDGSGSPDVPIAFGTVGATSGQPELLLMAVLRLTAPNCFF